MNKLQTPKLLIFLLVSSLLLGSCNNVFRKTERSISGSSRKTVKVREPRQVRGAKKEQEKRQSRIKKDYQQFVKASRKRSYEIQSPEVKARMKQNESNITAREKSKDKMTRAASKNRARKFR